MVTKIQSNTWMGFHNSNTSKKLQSRSDNHCHLLCCGRNHTPVPVLRWVIASLSHGKPMRRVSLRWTYKTIPTIRFQCMKRRNIPSVGSRSRAWRHTMTTCWMKKTPLGISQASKTAMECGSSWVACQMIRLSGSGKYTLSRIWNGMTITNALSNSVVEKSFKARYGWCGSQRTPRMLCRPHSVALTVICHRNTSIPKCALRTGGRRHR